MPKSLCPLQTLLRIIEVLLFKGRLNCRRNMCKKKTGICGIFQELAYLSELPFMRVMESLAIVGCVYVTTLKCIRLDFKYNCATAKLCTQGKPGTYWCCSRSCVVKQYLHLISAEVYTGAILLLPRIYALSVIFQGLSHSKGDSFSCILCLWFSKMCIF